jgi:hypothetical protein
VTRTWRLRVAACALLAVLAGCAEIAVEQPAREEVPVADEGTPTEVARLPTENFSPIIYNGVAPVPIAPVNDDPDQLLGMTSETLGEILGKPTIVRRDGGAEVWQYRSEACVLDLFLYGGMKQVEHVDLRDRGDSTDVMVRACFVRMLRDDIPTS